MSVACHSVRSPGVSRRGRWSRLGRLALILGVLLALCSVPLMAQWPQWGGPQRNFQAPQVPLAQEWPEDGPPSVWRRPLGDGTSAITVVEGTLYTLYRKTEEAMESVVALDAANGKTLWEHSYPAPLWEGFQAVPSQGPHSAPLAVGERLYTVGVRGFLKCWNRLNGQLLWERDLWGEYGGEPRNSGYSPSPLAWKDRLILPWGGEGQAVLALSLEDGSQIWASQDFRATYGSPLLIELGGRPQVVVPMAEHVAALDPQDGRLLWSHPHKNVHGINASTPLWLPGNRLFISSGYDGGSRMLHIKETPDGGFEAEELWYSRRVKIHHGTAVWLDGRIYASSGDVGPAFLVAVDPQTGEMAVRQRGFTKANFLAVGDILIILDQNGELALAKPGEERIRILDQSQVLTTLSWTVPSMAGSRLYLRDRREIAAFELGK
ncbi:MAG TPA: PQQ-binding-like beta-propeller repeat protein [Acidobacteriota bacterium]|nr:PQQ-binding-like beta-propeller repeat protein [Acidobacteriota bacterium]